MSRCRLGYFIWSLLYGFIFDLCVLTLSITSLITEKDEMLLRQSFSMNSNHTIEINKEQGFKNDISMLSDSLPLQSSSSKSTTNDNNNTNMQIQSSSSNTTSKSNNDSSTKHYDRPPRVRTSSNGSNVTNSNPGSANNSPKQRSPKPPLLSCVTDSNGGTGQFPSSPLGKFYDMQNVCVLYYVCYW